MSLKELKHIFHKELDPIFGFNEVANFFYLLIAYYLNLNRVSIVLEPNLTLTKAEEEPLFKALSRLKNEEPIQHILGETEFYGLSFKVSEQTLIPRPETEELVSWVLKSCANKTEENLKLLDIGTGSGCIAISLAKNLPKAEVFALDISENALKVAKKNAELNAVSVTFKTADILNNADSFAMFKNNYFDVIVSNPPYVRNLEKTEIKNNVLLYEPHLALFVDNKNPLQFYKAISIFANLKLKKTGQLFFEINQYLGNETKALLETYSFKDVVLKNDIFNNPRLLKGTK